VATRTLKFEITCDFVQQSKYADFCKKSGLLAMRFEPQTLDGQSRALKMRILAMFQIKKRKMTLGLGAQGPLSWAKKA